MPAGLGINCDFHKDFSHDGWNDVQGACRKAEGGFVFTNFQMTTCYNTNYQPFLCGSNMATKQELLREFFQLHPTIPDNFAEDLDASAIDSGQSLPADADEEDAWFEEEVLRNDNFQTKGYYVRMCVFFR